MPGSRIVASEATQDPDLSAAGQHRRGDSRVLGSALHRPSTRQSLGGLGRGLAGILDPSPPLRDGAADAGRPGLDQLLGQQFSTKAGSVRAFVVETALAVIADAFNAEGVIMTSRDRPIDDHHHDPADSSTADHRNDSTTPGLALRLPPSWAPSSPALFAVYGNLWEMLMAARHYCSSCGSSDQPLAYRQERVDSHWAWFCRIDDQAVSVAAALIRTEPFDETESDALARAMGSVVSAVSPSTRGGAGLGSLKTKTATDIALSANTDEGDPASAITAEVTIQDPAPDAPVSSDRAGAGRPLAPLTATGHGPDIETAVARAAANACQPQCRILFAGSSDLDGNTISIVIVDDESGAPRLGVSVRPVGDYAGVAEAVFLAASTGGSPSVR